MLSTAGPRPIPSDVVCVDSAYGVGNHYEAWLRATDLIIVN